MRQPSFRVTLVRGPEGDVVQLRGHLHGAVAGQFRDWLSDLAGPSILVDFTGLRFLDPSGLTALLVAQVRAERRGHQVRFRGHDVEVARLVELPELDALLADSVPQGPPTPATGPETAPLAGTSLPD